MSTKLKEKEEKIEQIIAKIVSESSRGVTILVEGKKDAENLHLLGVEGQVLTVKTGGKSFFDAVAEVEDSGVRSIILLLDFDRRGIEGTVRLVREFERLRIKVNVKFWRELKGLVGRNIQCIESLPTFIETLKSKTHA